MEPYQVKPLSSSYLFLPFVQLFLFVEFMHCKKVMYLALWLSGDAVLERLQLCLLLSLQ